MDRAPLAQACEELRGAHAAVHEVTCGEIDSLLQTLEDVRQHIHGWLLFAL